jgi:hypothetical protein
MTNKTMRKNMTMGTLRKRKMMKMTKKVWDMVEDGEEGVVQVLSQARKHKKGDGVEVRGEDGGVDRGEGVLL